MKFLKFLIPACAFVGLAACSKPNPAAQCGMAETQKAYLDSIYSALSDAKERDEVSIIGEKAAQRVRKMIESLKKNNPITFGVITAESYDAATGNIDCKVEVKLKPTGDFSTQSVQDQARDMESARSTAIFPVGFFDGRSTPMTAIFELRRSGDGKQIIQGAAGFQNIVGVAYELVSAKSLSDETLAANPGSNPNFKLIDTGAQALPAVGQCFETKVHDVGYRLEGVPDSGTDVTFEDGHMMVDYSVSIAASRWRSGDPVRLCVVSLPTNCPPEDNRGVTYKATNIRAKNDWIAADSSHECGGA